MLHAENENTKKTERTVLFRSSHISKPSCANVGGLIIYFKILQLDSVINELSLVTILGMFDHLSKSGVILQGQSSDISSKAHSPKKKKKSSQSRGSYCNRFNPLHVPMSPSQPSESLGSFYNYRF